MKRVLLMLAGLFTLLWWLAGCAAQDTRVALVFDSQRQGLGGPLDARPSALVVADLERDGRQELVVADYRGYISVWRYEQDAYQMVWKSGAREHAFALLTADLDLDGFHEIIAGRHNMFSIWRWSGGKGQEVWQHSHNSQVSAGQYNVGDTNGNGVPEIICGTRVYEYEHGEYAQVASLPNAVG